MKIIRTREKEEMEISVEELSRLVQSKLLREHADEILRILKHKDFEIKLNPNTFGKKTPRMTKATLAESINALSKSVDKKFKEYGNSEAMMGVDLAKKDSKDESRIVTSRRFGLFHPHLHETSEPVNCMDLGLKIFSEFKTNDDIRKEERREIEKRIEELREYYLCYNCLDWNVMPYDGPEEATECNRKVENERKRGVITVITVLDDLIRLIRKEQNDV